MAKRPERRPRGQDLKGAARCRPVFPFGLGTKAINRGNLIKRALPYLRSPVFPFHAEPVHAQEIRKGNMAVAVVVASIHVGIC